MKFNVEQHNSIEKKITVEVSRELISSKVESITKDLQKINKQREKEGLPLYANTRNLAAGAMRQLDSNMAKERKYYVDPDEAYIAERLDVEEGGLREAIEEVELRQRGIEITRAETFERIADLAEGTYENLGKARELAGGKAAGWGLAGPHTPVGLHRAREPEA